MKLETYNALKTSLRLQYELDLQELELKRMKSFTETNVIAMNETQLKIQKLHLSKQNIVVETLKLDIELFKTANNLE